MHKFSLHRQFISVVACILSLKLFLKKLEALKSWKNPTVQKAGEILRRQYDTKPYT
jgi:hypothetical protein